MHCSLHYNSQQRNTRNASGDKIPERDIALFCYLPLLPLTPPTEGFPWDDLRKFSTDVKGWLRYKMAMYVRVSIRPSVRLSVCLSGKGLHCDHTVHCSADLKSMVG